MKSIIFLFTALLSANAFAEPLRTSVMWEKDYTLKNVRINGHDEGYVAVAHMDYREEYIEIKIFRDPCGTLTAKAGQRTCKMAAQIMDELFVAWSTPKITKCNAYVYRGTEGDIRADGTKVTLRAVDWSAKSNEGSCKGIRLKGVFTVTATKEFYDQINGTGLVRKSYDLY